MNTAPYPTNPPYGAVGAPMNSAYPPPSAAYPPSTNPYPPQDNVYPPTASGYPPPTSSYPPPMAAPPPYSPSAPPYSPPYEPQITQTTNTTVVVAINNQPSYSPWPSEVGFDSKIVRLGKYKSNSEFTWYNLQWKSSRKYRNWNASMCIIIIYLYE